MSAPSPVQLSLLSIAFPVLSESQIAELGRCTTASPKVYPDGHVFFSVGDRDFKFYIIKSGEIEIIDRSGESPKTVVVHKKGEFTGDISHLTGLPAIVSAIGRGQCEVYEITGEALRGVLNQCPGLSDIILQAFIARRQLLKESPDFVGLRIIGSRYSADTFRIRDFLSRNRVLFTWTDLESDPEVDLTLKKFGVTEADTPVVACAQMLLLRNPTNRDLADAIGVHQPLREALYDLVVVGAGPAGLAAAVYGASEGLQTAILEGMAPGGQAGASMRIENYLGFPTGLTGAELAGRAILQANKFGAHLSVPSSVAKLECGKTYCIVRLESGEQITTKCLLIATGAAYRKLTAENCERFEGMGVYYAATPSEAKLCQGTEVVVVGGGNSAGQAAVYLSQYARKVLLLIRGDDLYKNMSSYLVHRIEQTANIELRCNTTIRKMNGDRQLESIEIVDSKTEKEETVKTQGVFSFIGADPRTGWLPEQIERDSKGFVQTGAELARSPHWKLSRQPFLLETSHPGIFAAGDVRSGSVKRVASAVGEGSMAVQFVHEALKHL